ncbi:MAG: LacI family DNA-binding transcriptional regulator [Chthoniobacter sp.]|nr:LacI family DNA-binding transcriptional regulator [Chthoniobacter sp.]
MKQIQTVRMAEIAQQLGVASSTISRALRDDPRISSDLRNRVRTVADKLGYAPNPLVSALMANRRRRGGAGAVDVIALITNYGGREDWRKKDVCRWEYEGIQRRARELGFRIEVFALADYRGDVARLSATLRARAIRGVLLGFSRDESTGVAFDCEGFCVGGLSAYFPDVNADRANFHGFYNVRLALDHMHRLGYRRPALIVPELNNRVSNNLWSGAFLDWQRKLPKRDHCEPFIPPENVSAAEFSDWLYRNAPDSLLVYKMPVRTFLAKRGVRVPDDIGVAYLYRTSDEKGDAAGIDGNLDFVGAAALDLVVERLYANSTGTSEHPKEVLIKGTWYEGATLPPRNQPAPPRSRAPAKAKR